MSLPAFPIRRWIYRTAKTATTGAILWLAVSSFVAYKFTRRPHPRIAEPPPAVAWVKIEPVRLHTSDGLELGAWYMPGREEGPSVILLHGYRRNRGATLPLAEILAREGCSVLTVSLRAHGDSEGEYCDLGYGARHDVVAAVEWLEKRRPYRPILVQGTSMGAAAAIFAADELKTRVSGYILECPYRDIRSAVHSRVCGYLPRPLDSVAYAGLIAVGPLFLPEMDRMSPIDRITTIPQSVPVLLMAGERDIRVPPAEVKAIYERVSSHARYVVIPGAVHSQLPAAKGETYRNEVVSFIKNK